MRTFFFIATLLFYNVNCAERKEIFSALEELTSLAENEAILIKEVKNLNVGLEHAIEMVKLKLDTIEKDHAIFLKDTRKYVENPLNSLLLIKRLSHDIDSIHSLFTRVLDNFLTSVQKAKLPTEEFEGAVEGLHRIQDIYNLGSAYLSKGIIEGKKYRAALSVDDLLLVGKEMMKLNEKYALEYLKLAKDKNREFYEIPELIFLEKLLEIYKENKIFDKALEIVDEILKVRPNHKNFEVQRLQLEMDTLYKAGDQDVMKEKAESQQRSVDLKSSYWTAEKEQMILSKACRGKLSKTDEELSKLHCRYQSKTPFTIIAPFKIEEANLDPYIAIFHEILSDKEINVFTSMLKDLSRAEIITLESSTTVSRRRVAKLKFFGDREHEILPSLTRRVEDMSGLNMETSEIWQLQNYGIGGHYNAHHDYTDEGQHFNLGTGNRIATALFYLTDVEKGGATVFPLLKIAIPPKKGIAVFWYNLSTSGDREVLTRHSGCPVLVGSKTVVNKWLHEYGQEFKRPCELEPKPTDPKYYLKHYNMEDYGIKITLK